MTPLDRLLLLARMEAACRATRSHLGLLERQIARRAESLTITDRALRGYPASLRHAARAAWEPLRPTSSVIALPDASLVPPARR